MYLNYLYDMLTPMEHPQLEPILSMFSGGESTSKDKGKSKEDITKM
jgi:hypothetical protein